MASCMCYCACHFNMSATQKRGKRGDVTSCHLCEVPGVVSTWREASCYSSSCSWGRPWLRCLFGMHGTRQVAIG